MANALSFPTILCESSEEFALELINCEISRIPVGAGVFGSVFFSNKIHSLAIKVFFQQAPLSFAFLQHAHHEAALLTLLNHKGVEQIPNLIFFLRGPKRCAIGMTKSSPDVFQKYLKKEAFPSFEVLRKYAFLWSKTLAEVHAAGVIHTDVKPQNLGDLVLDFNLAKDVATYQGKVVSSRCYRAPEVLMAQPFNKEIDVFSLAAVLFELYTGDLLIPVLGIENRKTDLLQLHILERRLGKPLPQSLCENNDFCEQVEPGDWVLKPIDTDLSQLLSFEEVVREEAEHRDDRVDTDIDDFIDLLGLMLEPDPSNRFTFTDVLSHPYMLSKMQNEDEQTASIGGSAQSVIEGALLLQSAVKPLFRS